MEAALQTALHGEQRTGRKLIVVIFDTLEGSSLKESCQVSLILKVSGLMLICCIGIIHVPC